MERKQAESAVKEQGGNIRQQVNANTDYVVVGMKRWAILPDGSLNKALQKAEELQTKGHQISIISESLFVDMLSKGTSLTTSSISLENAATVLELDTATIRRWINFGLIKLVGEELSFQDLVSLRAIAELVRKGVKLDQIFRGLKALTAILSDAAQPLSQTRLLMKNGDLVAEVQGSRIDTTGQYLLRFDDVLKRPDRIETLENNADVLFSQAIQHEKSGEYDEAVRCYNAYLKLDKECPEVHFNLGNVYLKLGDYELASQQYEQTLDFDSEFVEAWYNLGYVYDEMNEPQRAIDAFQRAISVETQYTDALFNLAKTMEKVGRSREAREHWVAFLKLESSGNDANYARQQLSLQVVD